MTDKSLVNLINDAFDARDTITPETSGEARSAVEEALGLLDGGQLRVAEPIGNHQWQVNQWLKKRVYYHFV